MAGSLQAFHEVAFLSLNLFQHLVPVGRSWSPTNLKPVACPSVSIQANRSKGHLWYWLRWKLNHQTPTQIAGNSNNALGGINGHPTNFFSAAGGNQVGCFHWRLHEPHGVLEALRHGRPHVGHAHAGQALGFRICLNLVEARGCTEFLVGSKAGQGKNTEVAKGFPRIES